MASRRRSRFVGTQLLVLVVAIALTGCPDGDRAIIIGDGGAEGHGDAQSQDTAQGNDGGRHQRTGGPDLEAASAELPPARPNPDAERRIVEVIHDAGYERAYAAVEDSRALVRLAGSLVSAELPDSLTALACSAAEAAPDVEIVTVQYYVEDKPYTEMVLPVESYTAWKSGWADDETFADSLQLQDLRTPTDRLADELSLLDMELRELSYTADRAVAELYYWADSPEVFLEDLLLAGMYTLNVLPWADTLEFHFLWDAENSLAVRLDSRILLEVLARDAEPSALLRGMEVARTGDYFAAAWPMERGEGEMPAPPARWVRTFRHLDNFSQVDRSFWYVWEEKTYRTAYDKLRCDDGILIIEAEETDRNPFVYSKALPIPENAIIRVRRSARVHYGNDYMRASFSLLQTSHGGQHPSRDARRQGIIGSLFLNFQYDPGRYPITKGILVTTPDYKDSGEFAVIADAPFDEWVEEELEYNTGTGEVVYRLDGAEYRLQSEVPSLPYFRIYMNAYGWYTGHKVEVDYLDLEILEPE
jgi:hypothetical protein